MPRIKHREGCTKVAMGNGYFCDCGAEAKHQATTTAERQRKLREANQAAALRDGFKDGFDENGQPITKRGKPVSAAYTALRAWRAGTYKLVRVKPLSPADE